MKIFISSVQKEFAAERKALAKMIREDRWLGGFFDVFLFEECTAKAKTPQKVYLDAVAESDIYIGLIGDAYGNVDKGGVSPTEREYDKAAELGKDRLMFVKANDDNREDPERQFLGKVSGAVTWHSYDTAAKLSESVYDALYDWLRDNDLVTDPVFESMTGHFKTIIWRRGYGKGLVKGLSARALCKGPSDRPKSLGPSRGAELKGPSRGGRVRGAESKEPSQFELVISLLAKCGDAMSASQIAKALNMHSVTGRLKKTFWTLLEDGIVERTERKINSRLQRYRLTDKGRSLAEKLLKKKGGGK